PEVEVVKQELEQVLSPGTVIEQFVFHRKDLRDPMPIAQFKKMTGARVEKIARRAKYLLIYTDRGGILSHLGMTGTWRVEKQGDGSSENKHEHIYIELSSGYRLIYRDPRRFGIFETFKVGNENANLRLKTLGPEPLAAELTAEILWQSLRGK